MSKKKTTKKNQLFFSVFLTMLLFAACSKGGSYTKVADQQAHGGGVLPTAPEVTGLSINDAVTNPEADTTAVFTVTLTPAGPVTVTVDYFTSNGTAAAGADYTAIGTTTLTFLPGETSKSINVSILDDTLVEGNETFTVNLFNPVNLVILDSQGIGTIVDNDTAGLTINDFTVNPEAAANAVFTVTLSTPGAATISVDYSTSNGTASYGSDYTAIGTTTLYFYPGETVKTITVPVFDDLIDEDNETFYINLSNPVIASITDSTGIGTIIDNDTAQISINDVTTNPEAATFAYFTVSLSLQSSSIVTVEYATSDGTASAGLDYSSTGIGTLTFLPGDLIKTISVPILSDGISEGNEYYYVNLSNSSGPLISDTQGVGVIIDDDVPLMSINDVTTAPEANTNAVFTVSLSIAGAETITVNYATSNGTALSGSDYTTTTGTLTFVPGDTSEIINVPILDDGNNEITEYYTVTLSNPSANVSIVDPSAFGAIIDNDFPSISINDVTTDPEANTNAGFTVNLSMAGAETITVNYATSNGTALSGSDYTITSGTLTFVPGDTSEIINVPILDDGNDEVTEYYTVTLSSPSANASIGDASAFGAIVDNDIPSISINDVTTDPEANTNASFTVNLSIPGAETITVNYATSNGTASSSSDYTATSGTLTFVPGDTSEIINVPILDDGNNEITEYYTVTLSAPSANASIGDATAFGAIIDNDFPSISIIDVTTDPEANINASFTVSLSMAGAETITVNYATSNGTALSGSDYTVTSGTLTFVPGDTSEVINVPILDDGNDEVTEYYTVTLSSPSANASIGDASAFGAIVDNDVPSISINDVTTDPEANTNADFTVSLSIPGAEIITVEYAASNGTALSGSDYAITSGALTFLPGDTIATISVPILDDGNNEVTEYYTVTLSNPSANASIGDDSAFGAIVDNDTPSISISDVTTDPEANTNASFTVNLSIPGAETITVNYATSNGTALSGSDYTITSGTLTFVPGDTSEIINVPILDDGNNETTEYYTVTLSSPSANATIGDATAFGAIVDNDVPSISINDVTTDPEANTNADFTVSLSMPGAETITVNYATANGTALSGSDYTITSGTLTFVPGDTIATISVPITDDGNDEITEYYTVTLSSPSANASIGDATAFGAIVDNDIPSISINDVTVDPEANTNAVFTVSLSIPGAETITVNYATSNGTASSSSDYTITSGTLTFGPGDTSEIINVPILDDGNNETTEYYTVTLSSPSANASIGDASAFGAIVDNDIPYITINDVTTDPEANTNADFTVSLSIPGAETITVNYATSDGTALSGSDYTITSGTLTFVPGDTIATISVPITDDGNNEITEYYTVTLSAPSANASIGDASAFGAIVDNDVPSITINDVTTDPEANTNADFTASLSIPGAETITVNYATSDGTALSGSDYTITSGTLTFVPGDTIATISVPITDDGNDEITEYYTVTLSSPSANASIGDATALGAIVDNDIPSISINDVTVDPEANTNADFTVSLSIPGAETITVDYATSNGTALSGSDYTAIGGSLTFVPGDTVLTISVPIIGDGITESDENFYVTLSNPSVNASIGDTAGFCSIIDNDICGITISSISGNTNEDGATATFDIVLDSEPASSVQITLSSSDPGEGTVSPAILTFTSGDWDTPRTITVTGVNDSIGDGNQVYTIIINPAESADLNYDGLDPDDITVTNADNDIAAGITVSSISGNTSETGTQAAFTIVLNSAPSDPVSIDLSSSDISEGTVSPGSVTFTTANWSTPQTVTVTGVDDLFSDLDQRYFIITGYAVSADTKYNGLDPANVPVVNIDDDTVGIYVSGISGNTAEDGTTATFSVVLESPPAASVTIAISSSDTSEGTVSASSLVFDTGDWDVPQQVTVTGQDDALLDGNQLYIINIGPASSPDPGYDGLDPANINLNNIDDDSPGITVSSISGNTNESGTTATFTVVLTSPPTDEVSLSLSSTNPSEGTVSPAALTFTSGNWSVARTVTVTGVDDAAQDGNQVFYIITSAASSLDPDYDGLDPDNVMVINSDNDTYGFTVSPASGLVTSESGTEDSFTVSLNSPPSADVILTLYSNDTTEGVVSPMMLTFTTVNWSAPQTVIVTGIDDGDLDGSQLYKIIIDPASSSDGNYNGLNPVDVSITNTDDDSPGFTILPASADKNRLTTNEIGTQLVFTVVLNSEPSDDVMLPLYSSDITEGTISPSALTFTAENWNVPQQVIVTGVDDLLTDGNVKYQIDTGLAVSTGDADYNGMNPGDVKMLNIDNDNPGVTIIPDTAQTSRLITTESGDFAEYYLVLNSQPTADVYLSFSSSNIAEGTISPAALTFSTDNWNIVQKITVTGVDDLATDGHQNYFVSSTASSGDTLYNGIIIVDVLFKNLDDETPDFIVDPNTDNGNPLITTESSGQSSFTMRLLTQPTANVTINFSSGDLTEGTVSPQSLTFTTINWNSPQIVTVTGVDDADLDLNIEYPIVFGNSSSSDPNYNLKKPTNVKCTNLDND